jgi:hypothetical protein
MILFLNVKLVHPGNAIKINPNSLIALLKQYPNLENQLNGSHADKRVTESLTFGANFVKLQH